MDKMVRKIDNSELNNCLNVIQTSYKDRNKRLGFDENEGHAKITVDELKEMHKNNIEMYSYKINDKIVGFISFRIEESYVKIKDLVVLPEHQKKGIGTILVEFAKKYLENNNKTILKLGMIYENKELLKWYQKQGFVITDIIEYPDAVLKTAKMEYRKDD